MKIKIPIWLQAVFFGILILEIGTRTWSLIAGSNIRYGPDIPWSFPMMALVLILAWNYLGGKWIPESTQKVRHLWMRANPLMGSKRRWIWISATLLGITILCFIVLGYRVMDIPSGQIAQVERIITFPTHTIISLIIMTSLVAGIIEEIAFRGYMQKPMELKYGPKTAIFLVALIFTLLHLPNATITPILIPIFFMGSLGWGVLAYLSNSIIPGIVVHCLVDMIGYLWIWRNLDLAKTLSSESVLITGGDTSFWVLIIILFIFTSLAILSFRKLFLLNRENP